MRTRNEVDVTSITLDEVMRLINPRIKKIRQTGEMQVMCPLNPKEDFDINTHTGITARIVRSEVKAIPSTYIDSLIRIFLSERRFGPLRNTV